MDTCQAISTTGRPCRYHAVEGRSVQEVSAGRHSRAFTVALCGRHATALTRAGEVNTARHAAWPITVEVQGKRSHVLPEGTL